jgi:starch-binding outer membrane protein, SusD/RagB family
MKINKTIFVLILISVFILPSCDDRLDLKPISTNTSENAYNSASDAEAALIGVYDSFSQEYYIWDNINFNDVISDNYYAGGDDPEIFAIENLKITPTNSRLFDKNWTPLFNAIAKANVVLKKIPTIKDPQLDIANRRSQILGEAYFLRGYHYYQLVKMWGGVPLIVEPVDSTDPSVTQKPRNTEAEVYAQIVSDLTSAVDRLPDFYSNKADVNKARATKGAANAMLAKVYAQKADRDYTKVLEHCNAVINSPAGYVLLGNYEFLWDGNHYNNEESIMEVQFTGGAEANYGPQLLLPKSISGDTWRKFVTPSHDLINAFDSEGDVIRKRASVLFESAPWVDEFWSVSLSVGASIPFAYKWKSASGFASTNRQYIVRLGDIILLKAEALNKLGRTEEARIEINKIRTRVALANTLATNQAQMQLAIEKERRLELAQEAQRWDDLRRYGRAVEVMNSLVEIDLRTNSKKIYDMTPEKQLLPIPQSERNRNPNLTQNPGYN